MKGDINFVIITQPRSGSYYFQSLLNSADDIVCHGEIFKKDKVELSRWHRNKIGIETNDVAKRNESPYEFLISVRKLNPNRIFGFKAFWGHLAPHNALVQNIIKTDSWKKIFLVRNPIESYASLQRAKETNLWTKRAQITNLWTKSNALNKGNTLVHFDPVSFRKHLAMYFLFLDRCQKLMASQGDSCYQIGYQDALNVAKQQEVLSFLGSSAKSALLKSDYVKQYSGLVQDSFENWDAVLDFLDKNNLEHFAAGSIDICEDRGGFV